MGQDRYHTGEYPHYPEGTHPDAGIIGRDQSLRVQQKEPTLSTEAVHVNNIKYAAARRWWALPPRIQREWDDFSFLTAEVEFPPLVTDGGSSVLNGQFISVEDVEGKGPGCLIYAERIIEERKRTISGSKQKEGINYFFPQGVLKFWFVAR